MSEVSQIVSRAVIDFQLPELAVLKLEEHFGEGTFTHLDIATAISKVKKSEVQRLAVDIRILGSFNTSDAFKIRDTIISCGKLVQTYAFGDVSYSALIVAQSAWGGHRYGSSDSTWCLRLSDPDYGFYGADQMMVDALAFYGRHRDTFFRSLLDKGSRWYGALDAQQYGFFDHIVNIEGYGVHSDR